MSYFGSKSTCEEQEISLEEKIILEASAGELGFQFSATMLLVHGWFVKIAS